MGKCLSCCPADQPSEFQEHQIKFTDTTRKIENSGSVLNFRDSWATRAGNSDASIIVNSNGETYPNSASSTASTVAKSGIGLTEKFMFYPRIPPICYNSNSDSKRSSQCNREYSETRIYALFEQYKDDSDDAILSEGIERLCQDLDVKPDEFRVLLLAWKFGAEQMCRFTRQEFSEGCKALKTDSIQGIQSRFIDMVNEVCDPDRFKDLYRFTFKFALEIGQRILPSEVAIQLWKIVFSIREPPILNRWLDFLEKHPHIRGIPRDTWNMFLNFSEAVGDDLSTYDDTEAWPSLFDDFVEYENDQTNQNIHQSKDKDVLEM